MASDIHTKGITGIHSSEDDTRKAQIALVGAGLRLGATREEIAEVVQKIDEKETDGG